MSNKSAKITALIQTFRGRQMDAHYLGYFECFNRGLFYEAHDVLEELWLGERGGPDGLFYKGLIQLAGAFVHLQKGRLRPAAALFKLARANLERYPERHRGLSRGQILGLADHWLASIEKGGFERNPLVEEAAPRIEATES